ncbi:MAG: polyphosphate kinase 1 [Vicingaceae bacterium]
MAKEEFSFHDREISWLSFNERVLQEAEDPNVPLIERLRFLGIYSNNLDEFFRVRVPTVQRMSRYGRKAIPVLGFNPKKTLKAIYAKNRELQDRFEDTYEKLKEELEEEKIYFLDEAELNEHQKELVAKYFDDTVRPTLVPVMLSEDRELPELNGKAIYLAIKFYNGSSKNAKNVRYALLEIPSAVVSRFYVLADEKGRKNIVLLDDVIRTNLRDVFHIFHYEHIEAYTIKITRDAELDIEDDVTTGFMEKLAISLKNRKKGDPVRLVHDEKMPKDLLKFLTHKVGMEADDVVVPGGRYHNFKDFIDFPKIGAAHLRYRPMPSIEHPILTQAASIFEAIRKQDILLSYPYQSYHHVIDLLREAAIDPQVSTIKITIYRLVSKNSKVVHSLINAARNGKKVTVVVELKARFDEESNMHYADKLQDEGVQVIFGAAGLKVHTKLLLIKRKEGDKHVRYAHIGTGNFHEGTARLYCDHSLLTRHKKITSEVNKVFKFFKDNYKRYAFKELLVAPFNLRERFYELIDQEIENAKAGKEAYMIIKVNSIQDKEMAEKVYQAHNAGVEVKLIARSINNVVNGVADQSENIESISIVDRLLEHARIMLFCHGGEEKMFMGSSDWMKRNLDGRVEVMVPIYDAKVKEMLKTVLEYQLKDNVKARLWDAELSNQYKPKGKRAPFRSQYELYDYFREILKEGLGEEAN